MWLWRSAGCGPVLAVFALIAGCTQNPLGDGTIRRDRASLRGTVALRDGGSPEGVFIWQHGLDMTTFSDAAGNFTLTIPADRRDQAGTVRQDTIYFYLANYFVSSIIVSLQEGEYAFDRGAVDADGKVREPVLLQRFLRISTEARFEADGSTPQDTVLVRVSLQADVGCADVVNPHTWQREQQRDPSSPVPDTLGAILIHNLQTGETMTFRSDPDVRASERLRSCENEVIRRELRFVPAVLNLPRGQYEMIPYLWINPDALPAGLLAALGREVDAFDANYLKKPMRREGGYFSF